MVKKLVIPLVVAVALLGASCGKSPSPTNSGSAGGTSGHPVSGTVNVTIQNFAFSPATLFVTKGTVITVTNQDFARHSYTADGGSFDLGVLAQGKSGSVTMNTVGTFKVHCSIHPSITGTITVE